MLSRFPQEVEAPQIAAKNPQVTQVSPSDWVIRQQEDPALREVSEWLQRGKPPTAEERGAAPALARRPLREWRRLRLEAGVLQREVRERHTGDVLWQTVLAWTHTVWNQYHQAMGHMSATRIEAAMRRGFFWPRLGQDVRDWSSNRPQCIQSKDRPKFVPPRNGGYGLFVTGKTGGVLSTYIGDD